MIKKSITRLLPYQFLKRTSPLLTLLMLGTWVLGSCDRDLSVTERIQTETFINLDGVDTVPEWLMVEVENALPIDGLNIWIPTNNFQASSLKKVPRFPRSNLVIQNIENGHQLELEAIRNEQVSAQLALAAIDTLTNVHVSVSDFVAQDGATVLAGHTNVRYVQYVPVNNALVGVRYQEVEMEGVSGYGHDIVADPLVELDMVDVPMLRAQPVWFTFMVSEKTAPGRYDGTIEIYSDQFDVVSLPISLTVYDYVLPDIQDYSFDLDVWIHPVAIADFHGVEPWSEEHWDAMNPYFENLASWGQDKITTIITDQPWKRSWLHGEYREQTASDYLSMIQWTLRSNGDWSFDYTVYDRYVETSLEYGIGPYITNYAMLVFRGPERLTYFDEKKGKIVTEYINVSDDRYQEVWGIFLSDFKEHLDEKGWFDQTLMAFDERPVDLMSSVFSVLYDVAPEFLDKIYMSGTEFVDRIIVGDAELEQSYAGFNVELANFPGMMRENLNIQDEINNRSSQGLPTSFYVTCCSGAHPNIHVFNPSTEFQVMPWIALKYNMNGFLNWAYNSWPEDVFRFTTHQYPQGGEYLVYPSETGPLSSIRWELIKEGMEDFELARILQETEQIDDASLDRAIDIATRNIYGQPKDPLDLVRARQRLLGIN